MLLLSLAVAILSQALCYPICPNRTSIDDKPEFTKALGDFDYVEHGQSVAIQCCSDGVSDINWYRLDDNSWKPFPPKTTGQSDTPQLQENKQILRIYHATFQDNTTFRCNLVPPGRPSVGQTDSQMIHTLRLHVVACDRLSRGPLLTDPFPTDQYIDRFGVNLTVPCAGYFGCSDAGDFMGDVDWFVKENGIYKKAVNVSSRYSVTQSELAGHTVMRAALSISSVHEADINRVFVCVLSSPQIIKGESQREIRIIKQEEPETINKGLWIGIAVAGVFVIVFVFCLFKLIGKLWGPQIKWYFRSRISFVGPKSAVDEDLIHNAFIFHAEEDIRQAYDLKKLLQEQHFDIFLSSDVPGNKSRQLACQEASNASAVVIFLYSENLWEDPFNSYFLQSIVEYRQGKGIFFLEIEEYSAEKVKERTEKAKEDKKKQPDNKVESSLEEDYVKEEDNVKADKSLEKKKEKDFDIRFWRALPRLKVPSEKASVRKKTNFQCSIQNRLPLLKHQVSENVGSSSSFKRSSDKSRHSSSCKPLISGCPSPGAEISPLSDEVFVNSQERRRFVYDNIVASRDSSIPNAQVSKEPVSYQNETTVIVDVDVHAHVPRDEDIDVSLNELERQAYVEVINEAGARSFVHSVNSEETASPSEQGMFVLSGEEIKSGKTVTNTELLLPNNVHDRSYSPGDESERLELGDDSERLESGYTEGSPAVASDTSSRFNSVSDNDLKSETSTSVSPGRAFQNGPQSQKIFMPINKDKRQPSFSQAARGDSLESGGSNSNESGYITSPTEGPLSARSMGSSPEANTVNPFLNPKNSDINMKTAVITS